MPTLNKRLPEKHKQRKRKRFYGYNWSLYSKARLKKHRLCVYCLKEGITTPATVTDHIQPMSQGGSEWDESNHQSLCIAHHNSKTAKEMKRNYEC